jgi:hypothetical protein
MVLMLSLIFIFMLPSLWADTTPQTLGSDTITFKGFIESGLYFSVSRLTETSYNLLSDELQPDGDGVDIGSWTLRVDNPPVTETTFTITYSFAPLRSTITTIEDEIDFILLERPEDNSSEPVEKNNIIGTEVSIVLGSGLNTVTRVFSARLTNAGANTAMRAAATDTYQSDITVSLAAE